LARHQSWLADGCKCTTQAGIVNRAFKEWFNPFRAEVVEHPFALE